MSELRKANTDNTYFITFTIVGWIDVFTRSIYSDIMIDSLIYCQRNKSLDIFSYVIMPSHLHFIARSLDNNMSDIISGMKSFTIEILDEKMFNQKRDYIHNNPVAAGLVMMLKVGFIAAPIHYQD